MASVSCVVNAGAVPVFAEVDADSGNITAQSIAAVLTPRTKAAYVLGLVVGVVWALLLRSPKHSVAAQQPSGELLGQPAPVANGARVG